MRKNSSHRLIKAVAGLRPVSKIESVRRLLKRNAVEIDFELPVFRRMRNSQEVLSYLHGYEGRAVRDLLLIEPGRLNNPTSLLKALVASGKWNVHFTTSSRHIFREAKRHWADNPIVQFKSWMSLPLISLSPEDFEAEWNRIYIYDVVDGMEAACGRRFGALIEYYSDHLGEVLSNRRTATELKFRCRHSCATVVGNYRQRLEDAFLVEFVDCYDTFENMVIKNQPRVFMTNLELRQWRFGPAPTDESRRVKLNQLYLKLRREYETIYWPRDHKGDDFMTIGSDGKKRYWKV